MSLPPAWPLRARVALLALLPLLAAPSVQAAAAAAAQLDQRGHSTVPQQLCDPLQTSYENTIMSIVHKNTTIL